MAAIRDGARIFSSYLVQTGVDEAGEPVMELVFVITEANRAATMVLFAHEY